MLVRPERWTNAWVNGAVDVNTLSLFVIYLSLYIKYYNLFLAYP